MATDPQPVTTCECGDPKCVYVANLATAIDWLKRAAGQPTS